MSRDDIWLSMLFFAFLALMRCGAYVLGKIQLLDVLLPFACCFLILGIRTGSSTFSQIGEANNSKYVDVGNDIVDQFVEADENGESEMVLYVPEFDSADNFPLATYGGPRISATLYRHGITANPITVTQVVPTREKNQQFGLY